MKFLSFRICRIKPGIWKIFLAVFILIIGGCLSVSCSGDRPRQKYYYDPSKDSSTKEKPASPYPVKKKYYYDPA